MVLGLGGVAACHVVHYVVAQSGYQLFVGHRIIDTGILEEPTSAVVVPLVDVANATTSAKEIHHAPAKALDAIGAIVQVDAQCAKNALCAHRAAVVLGVSPAVLKLRELSGVGSVSLVPRPVEVFTQAVCPPIFVVVGASVVSVNVPTVNVADLLQRPILAGVVVVHLFKEAA